MLFVVLPLLQFFCSASGNTFLSTGAHPFLSNHLQCAVLVTSNWHFPVMQIFRFSSKGMDVTLKKKKIEQLKVILDSGKFLEKTGFILLSSKHSWCCSRNLQSFPRRAPGLGSQDRSHFPQSGCMSSWICTPAWMCSFWLYQQSIFPTGNQSPQTDVHIHKQTKKRQKENQVWMGNSSWLQVQALTR